MTNSPVIETERLRLRRPVEADYLQEVEFWQSDRAAYVGGKKSADEVWRMFALLEGHWQFRGYGFFAVEDKNTGEYYGHIGPWYPEGWPDREIGWTVLSNAEGKSIAYEAAIAARDYAYNELGWDSAISVIETPNTRSIKLAERMGATHSGEKFDYETANVVLDIYRHPSKEALQ